MSNRKSDPFFIEKSSKNNRTHRDTNNRQKQTKNVTPSTDSVKKEKKPFDKKKWRHKKYSIDFKMKKWEESRKKKMLYKYRKDVKNKDQGFDVQKIYEEHEQDIAEDDTSDNQEPESSRKNETYSNDPENNIKNRKLGDKFQRTGGTNEEKGNLGRGEFDKKQSRTEIPKKKFRKTKKGQPVMKDRLESLFERIKHSVMNEKE
ncbi:hypothetical protein WA026_011828 [Henosepilachna vigintioctopunctata]|uniref:Uncharacterized protein n=1 Tax=Henosepilachna vigintioctopunctata TaxID=420089 RepID=A0AAW1UHB6_9CUCU